MQFAEINNVILHYQVLSGPGDKPTLVFINSLGTDFRIWRDMIVNFAGEMPIIAYDKRGHGLSSTSTSPYTMDDHAEDLIALLEHLGVRRTILCGVSVGGMIAMSAWAKRPDLIEALVLCDTGHRIGNADMWNERILAVEKWGIEALADATMERWFTESFHENEPAALQGYHNMLCRQPVEGYTGTCAAIRDCDLEAVARRISVPTLCVVGDQDGSTPVELVEELSGLIAGSKFQIINEAGHLPGIEQAEILSQVMKKFIAALLMPVAANGNETLQ